MDPWFHGSIIIASLVSQCFINDLKFLKHYFYLIEKMCKDWTGETKRSKKYAGHVVYKKSMKQENNWSGLLWYSSLVHKLNFRRAILPLDIYEIDTHLIFIFQFLPSPFPILYNIPPPTPLPSPLLPISLLVLSTTTPCWW